MVFALAKESFLRFVFSLYPGLSSYLKRNRSEVSFLGGSSTPACILYKPTRKQKKLFGSGFLCFQSLFGFGDVFLQSLSALL